ncbi:MAG: SDR family oxidoreductase [Pigmentiphaga sp.]|uniref:SDR family NAD(P)-dependent oxidoreductase n=1 Tax=Pigmentiphaga sp. TaxID=1977564 RepID=UPI0029B8F451|nr:SDR family oxidoreductase [Pigmentiphaga sp.]MDX3904375.1 SDR family oxidoreductase [Pigmentiphaga sp.]
MRLKDKVALVTGAAGGIGLAIAKRYSQEGARVVLVDRAQNVENEALAQMAGPAKAMRGDVTDPAQVAEMVALCEHEFGGVDICVCNAGVIRAAEFLDLTLEDLDFVMNVNVRGTFLVAQAASKAMVRQGRGGSIITLSSMTAELAMSNQLAYGASKGAVRQMTKAMALAMAPHGVRVNALGPGSIDTDIMATITDNPEALHTVLSRIPMARLGRPDEVAGVAVFLASDDASYVTGQTVYADGGRLALNYTVPVPGRSSM